MQKYKNGLKFTIKPDADFSTSMAPEKVIVQYRECIGKTWTVCDSSMLGGSRWIKAKENDYWFQIRWCNEILRASGTEIPY